MSLDGLFASIRQGFVDWQNEQRIAAVAALLGRCRDREAAHALANLLRDLVSQRSPGQVARMEARKGLR